jgi:hypothetical protein
MVGSAKMGQKGVGLCGKGGNCLESKQIAMRKCGERRLVQKAVETLKKCEYACKMGGTSTTLLYIICYV